VYDKRSATFHRNHVSLSTVDGRIKCDYILPDDSETPPTKYVSDEDFKCQSCGYQNHADYNASKNIGLQYLSRRQNAGDGGAPVDVRLNRGTLNVSGEYVPPASTKA
jgi:hypothetical protein